MKLKVWHLIALTALFTALLTVGIVYHVRKVRSLSHAVTVRNEIIRTYEIRIDTVMERVAEANLRIVQASRLLQTTKEENVRLKQEGIDKALVIGELRLQVSSMQDSLILYRDSIKVPVVNIPVTHGDTTETKPMVEIPLSFGAETAWSKTFASIDINGRGTAGFEVKSLPINISLGSHGFFNKQYISAVSTPNPEVQIDANNFQIVKQDRWKPVLIGTGVGGIVGGIIVFMFMK